MSFSKAPPGFVKVAAFLRKHVASQDAISIERRVEIFEGKAALETLLSSAYESWRGKDGPAIKTPEAAKLILKRLLGHGFFVKANIKGTKAIPMSSLQQQMAKAAAAAAESSSQGRPASPIHPSRILVVEPDPAVVWTEDGQYIWIYEGSRILTYFYSFGLLLLTLSGVMYQLWPPQLKYGAWLLSMLGLSLIGALFALAIVRAFVYGLSLLFSHGFWIFPNLFEDCGFFESFVPLYGWELASTTASPAQNSRPENQSTPSVSPGNTEKLD